ncbi:MAG: hypothetical protein EXR85_06410 [Xanthomonadales bacterium]|nr:hypothetical protein [Xanthomonadales bacterium]
MTTSDSPILSSANPPVPQWLLLLLVSGVGALLLWYASAWGVGVWPDSAEYIAAARRMDGFGALFTLPTEWAPGYPVLLALAYLVGDDVFAVTRVLQCLLFAGNLAAAMLLLRELLVQQGNNNSWLPVGGGVVLLFSQHLWQVNFYACSEGPFLLCQQLSALVLLRYLAHNNFRLLGVAAALAALALLFRYAGIAWVGAGSLALLLLQQGDLERRFRSAVIFGSLSLAPFLLWLIANKLLRDETTNREFVVHLVTRADFIDLAGEFASWFAVRQGLFIFLVEVVLCVAVSWLALRRFATTAPPLRRFVVLSAVYVVVYTLVILFSKSFLDAYIPFDDRMFVPAYLFSMLALLACAHQLLLSATEQRTRVIAMLALAFVGVFNAVGLLPVVAATKKTGIGYLSAYMASLSQVEDVPQLHGKIVYSNAPDYLRMRTDFVIHDYPRKFSPTTQLANPEYENELATMRSSVQAGAALLVHYQDLEWRSYFPPGAELEMLGFETILRGNGVRILSFPVAAPAPATE